jgi:alkyl sulfatase BDS1-like metallo-beta-lactamase superfamily hydrolase
MKRSAWIPLILLACATTVWAADPPATPPTPPMKAATPATKAANAAVLQQLPFQNRDDFAEAQRGLIAPIDPTKVTDETGKTVWNLDAYTRFVGLDTPAPDTVNPSLWRQLQLLTVSGLFKVTDRVYQVRGYDLSNVSILEGETGLIVVDPLVSSQTAKAALDLYYKHRPKKPVVAVIFTHSHVDHFAGVLGVASEADMQSKKVRVYAPDGFLDEAVSENVIAGNAMMRRAVYMYGALLPKGPQGQTSAGLGLTNSLGTQSLVAPSDSVTEAVYKTTIDGLELVFQLTPGTEAPAEMNFYVPQLHALCMAENLASTFHNVLTLRGAKVRDPLVWSQHLQKSIDLFARTPDDAQVVFTSHHWPKWGHDVLVNYMSKQRDLYKYIHDQSVRLFNQGYTMIELAEKMKLPPSLAQEWFNRDYYGTVNHNSKAVYQRYLGWFDGNPAHLYTYPPSEGGRRYVEYMGGADAVLQKARKSFAEGDYRFVAEVVSHVVFSDPANKEARTLEADALEQLGYQAESGPWRDFFLMGAQELRLGVLKPPGSTGGVSDDTVKSMGVELLLDYVAIHLNGEKAAGKTGTYDFAFTDVPKGSSWRVTLGNAVLNYAPQPAASSPSADATLTTTRIAINAIMAGRTTYEQSVQSGAIQVAGNQAKAAELFAFMEVFEAWFNIVTP